MALSQRSRAVIYRELCEVIDEVAVEELLSCFPVRHVERPASTGGAERHDGTDATTAERCALIEARLAQLEARIEILATDTRDGLARIEQHIAGATSRCT